MKIKHMLLIAALGLSLAPALTLAQGTGSSATESAQSQGEEAIQASGTVLATNPGNNKITLDHEAIPELGWPRMKMPFTVAPGVDLKPFSKGDKVEFSLSPSEGGHKITRISKK